MGTHNVHIPVPGFRGVLVPGHLGLLLHYRKNPPKRICSTEGESLVRDRTIIQRLYPLLLDKVRTVEEAIGTLLLRPRQGPDRHLAPVSPRHVDKSP